MLKYENRFATQLTKRLVTHTAHLGSILIILSNSTALADRESDLGRALFNDRNLSLHRNQSCASCHTPEAVSMPTNGMGMIPAGFADPQGVRLGRATSEGSSAGRFGGLNAPSAAYAAFSPEFHWEAADETYVGGQFWNGRASDLQSQAGMPILNPVEMGMPSKWAVVSRLKANMDYRGAFMTVFGIDLSTIPDEDAPAAGAIAPAIVDVAYAAAAQAISQFERSAEVNRFTSKFDFWLAGKVELTELEKAGLKLFNGSAQCALCHPSEATRDDAGRTIPPLFTDFTYDNLGIPRNKDIPGDPSPDPGLHGRPEIAAAHPDGRQLGKHKVMTLRNVAATAPYGHNGVFKTLKQLVHFYNTRDVLGQVESNLSPGFGVQGWPEPEISENVNTEELGNLGLTDSEEEAVVAFLQTLTDGYPETANDPAVPAGTPSPFAYFTAPEIESTLAIKAPGVLRVGGRMGKSYDVQRSSDLGNPNSWQHVQRVRIGVDSAFPTDPDAASADFRFYRLVPAQ